MPSSTGASKPAIGLNDEMRRMLDQASERAEKYLKELAVEAEKKMEQTRQRSLGNTEQATKIRESFRLRISTVNKRQVACASAFAVAIHTRAKRKRPRHC